MSSIKFDIVVANAEELKFAAAAEVVHQAVEAVSTREIFTVVLSGGSTPKSLYMLLAFKTYRVTLTPPALNTAACVIFLASGEEKAETLRAVLEGDYQPDRFPAQVIRPTQGKLLWLTDQAAASRLRQNEEIA